MVRPNQVVRIEDNEISFLMFGRSETQAERRVLFINFPSTLRAVLLGSRSVQDFIADTEQFTEGMVNRYIVTVDTRVLQ